MSDHIGVRGSAREKAEDLHNAKTAAFNEYTDELHALRCSALTRIAALADRYGTSPVPNDDLRDILARLGDNVHGTITRFEAKVQLIEAAYK